MGSLRSIGRKRPVTVVGAGFSGLVSAFYLSRAGFEVEVIEASERAGGLISTLDLPFGLVETAANGMLNSARVEELFGLVGVELAPTMKTARKRYIFRDGWPRRWPLGVSATLRMLGFALRALIWRRRLAPRAGESVRDWAYRVMGREAAQYTVEAALMGIYAGDPGRMSAKLIFGRFFEPRARDESRQAKPRVRGTVSTYHGMGELIAALRKTLENHGVKFRFGTPYATPQGVPSTPLVIATSAHRAAEILRSIDPVRAEALESVELVPVITATIAFKEAPPETRGFGCLFPPIESRRALGVLMNNYIFPHRAKKGFNENWIMGGAKPGAKELLDLSDQEIINVAIEERQATLNASGDVLGFKVTRWPNALPHYTTALEGVLPELLGLRQNAVLIGNYLGQIGLAKILDRAFELPNEVDQKGEWR